MNATARSQTAIKTPEVRRFGKNKMRTIPGRRNQRQKNGCCIDDGRPRLAAIASLMKIVHDGNEAHPILCQIVLAGSDEITNAVPAFSAAERAPADDRTRS